MFGMKREAARNAQIASGRKLHLPACLAALSLAVVLAAPAQVYAAEGDEAHKVFVHEEIEWMDGPGSLPPGATFALLQGDPQEEGPLTLRVRFPADYEIPPHTHPQIEHVTVVSGTFKIGMGIDFDREATTEVPAGGFVVIPVGHEHFAWVSEETEVQLHSTGPWGIDYVNPEDDPRVTD